MLEPEKTYQLLAALKAAVPFEVELTPWLITHLQAQQVAGAVKPREIASQISYAGDEGGIVCHIVPKRQMVGPFILFDQIGPVQLIAGQGMDVRPHPHIGLATVTYLFR